MLVTVDIMDPYVGYIIYGRLLSSYPSPMPGIFVGVSIVVYYRFGHGYFKGQGSRSVKIGPVSKFDEIWLYCMCMSSVTENDFYAPAIKWRKGI